MQEMISLAKSEVGVLRELARNVTDSGKEYTGVKLTPVDEQSDAQPRTTTSKF